MPFGMLLGLSGTKYFHFLDFRFLAIFAHLRAVLGPQINDKNGPKGPELGKNGRKSKIQKI